MSRDWPLRNKADYTIVWHRENFLYSDEMISSSWITGNLRNGLLKTYFQYYLINQLNQEQIKVSFMVYSPLYSLFLQVHYIKTKIHLKKKTHLLWTFFGNKILHLPHTDWIISINTLSMCWFWMDAKYYAIIQTYNSNNTGSTV